jgi:hypothetical protein
MVKNTYFQMYGILMVLNLNSQLRNSIFYIILNRI